ncbi:hypothetical protein [Petrachloros mirabilis]
MVELEEVESERGDVSSFESPVVSVIRLKPSGPEVSNNRHPSRGISV